MYVSHTVAIIIEEEPLRQFIAATLREHGHEVVASDRFDAFELSHSHWTGISLLLIDEPNARRFKDALIRRRTLEPEHPALLLLADDDSEADDWFELGIDDVLPRSLSERQFRARIEPHLRLHEQSVHQFQTLFENTPLGVFRLTPDGRLVVANAALVSMLGYESLDDLKQARTDRHRIPLPPPHAHVIECVWRRKDDAPLPVLQRTRPLWSPQGEILFFDGMVEDATQRKVIEVALRDHATRLTLALDAAQMGDFVYDFKNDELQCGFQVFRLFGFAEEPRGRGRNVLLSRVHPEDQDVMRRSLRGLVRAEDVWDQEFRVMWPDGSVRWLAARGELVRNEQRRPDRLIGVIRDATAEKQLRFELIAAKQEAENLAQLKSVFLANMSHEIRTPLTAIIGFASLLIHRVPEASRPAVRRIQEGGQRLLETLNAVLLLARLESGQMEFQPDEIDLVREVRSALQMFEEQARGKNLDLRLEFESEPIYALLDSGAITSILQNLISNAVKFTERGEVVVQIETRNGDRPMAWIRVRDTGAGVDPHFIPHIFDEFKQESSGMRRQHEGTGLGLAIVRRLVEAQYGEIRMESTKGRGSTFSVGFPLVEKPAVPVSPASASDPDPGDAENRLSLLVVEDNADTRQLLEVLLRDQYAIAVAADAREAIRLARGRTFDVVLMDINLGGGASGEEVAVWMRERPAYRDVPIVALTAYALPGDAERFLAHGFSAHLPKPFDPDVLHDLIRRLKA